MNYIKHTFLFITFLLFFIIINTNLSLKIDRSFFESVVFALITEALFIQPKLKFIFIVVVNVMFLIMVIFYTFGYIEIATLIGSLAFGILLIEVLFYAPQLIRNGYIKDA